MHRFFAACILAVAVITAQANMPLSVVKAATPINIPSTVDAGPPIERGPAKVDEKSEQILKQMSAYYSGLDSMAMKMQSSTAVEGSGNRGEITTIHNVLFKRPNKFAMSLKSGIMGGTVVCNGKDAVLYTGMLNRYIKSAAPEQAADLFDNKDIALVAPGGGKLGMLDVLIAPDPMQQLNKGLLGSEYLGVEKLDGVDTDHLKLVRRDATIQAWISRGEKPLLKQVSVDLSETLKSPEARKVFADNAELKNSKALSTFKYTNFEPNATVTDNDLAFTPPEESKQSRSIMEMITGALMQPKPADEPSSQMSVAEAEKLAALSRTPEMQAKAQKILQEMSSFYAGQKQWSSRLVATNRIETKGIRSEVASVYQISFAKPAKMSIVLMTGVNGGTVVSDGEQLTLFRPALNKYLVKKAPASISDVFNDADMHLATSGGFEMFLLDDLVAKDPFNSMVNGTQELEYYGTEKVNDQEAHHIKIVASKSAVDLWVSTGPQPLLLRVSPDFKRILSHGGAGKLGDLSIELSGTYKTFDTSPIADTTFKFTPPEGVRLVKTFLPDNSASSNHPLIGKPAPEATLHLLDGRAVTVSSFKNKKVVVLDFWATWCGPCVRALPVVTKVTQALKAKGVEFIAVNMREDPQEIKQFLQQKGISPVVAIDREGATAALYEARAIPQTVIIGKDGLIKAVHVGLSAKLEEELTKELNAVLSGASSRVAPQAGAPKVQAKRAAAKSVRR